MKMRQSNSSPIFTPTDRQRQQSIVVYSLAINDSQGLSTRAFTDEDPVLQWLADYAEGPDDAERSQLRKLAREADKVAFWRYLFEAIPPYVQYRLQCHTLTVGGPQ